MSPATARGERTCRGFMDLIMVRDGRAPVASLSRGDYSPYLALAIVQRRSETKAQIEIGRISQKWRYFIKVTHESNKPKIEDENTFIKDLVLELFKACSNIEWGSIKAFRVGQTQIVGALGD
ncbi:hypothetical protein J6590_037567 [Homalodisca vitripennis]|nr:hypothetical protein J6590_037567 [Homalodisca vitripennis]